MSKRTSSPRNNKQTFTRLNIVLAPEVWKYLAQRAVDQGMSMSGMIGRMLMQFCVQEGGIEVNRAPVSRAIRNDFDPTSAYVKSLLIERRKHQARCDAIAGEIAKLRR